MIIITGDIQSGKSTAAADLAEFLEASNRKISGVLAKGLWKNNLRHGFDLIDLATKAAMPFARRKEQSGPDDVTGFDFFESGLAFAAQALDVKTCGSSDAVFVDEVGKMELAGAGLAPFLVPLLSIRHACHIWIVRKTLVKKVCDLWKLNHPEIIDISRTDGLPEIKARCIKNCNISSPQEKKYKNE